jgi:Transport and Golgi organisation 2
MCTVTFSPRKQGYALGMNRDEKLTRASGLPPSKKLINGRAVLSPSEPGGGTWIALNNSGVTFALINWYSITAQATADSVSRGEVVRAVSGLDSFDSASVILEKLPLKRINPFRLIGIHPAINEIVEWRWDLKKLAIRNHRWKTQQWISSGFDEPTAQYVRGKNFLQARCQHTAGSLDWLRRLHRSHSPESGPFSTCMHRDDAATVSYTEITVSPRRAKMSYQAAAPCRKSAPFLHHISLKSKSELKSLQQLL